MRHILYVCLILIIGMSSTDKASAFYVRSIDIAPTSELPLPPPPLPRFRASNKYFHQVGIASYYADSFNGRKTSSGVKYEPYRYTAASKTIPLGSIIKVTNLENGKTVLVEVNDRGPYVGKRILDLSRVAASRLHFIHKGLTKIGITIVKIN